VTRAVQWNLELGVLKESRVRTVTRGPRSALSAWDRAVRREEKIYRIDALQPEMTSCTYVVGATILDQLRGSDI
jgi:hypothetical protein